MSLDRVGQRAVSVRVPENVAAHSVVVVGA
jgi:hypothetical protein